MNDISDPTRHDPTREPYDSAELERARAVLDVIPEKIGRYRVLERIGGGGMGDVFVAEQTEPIKRRVALKLIKAGMDTRQVVARFEAERQALAMMDHPNIAKVFDAGATDTGRPYFVMELVRGVPITDFCDANKLTTRQRVELLVPVCQAVQHAHQKGIIHRDIKPTNVLVTLHDGKPVPKVIDFGIAKATSQPLTDKTVYTEFRAMIGTPAYMSPEQAEMSGLDIDTRSDIYSLGVLTYELLTGTTPFDTTRLFKAGLAEIQRIIKEEDPPRPSLRLSTMAAASRSTIAAQRGIEPARIGKLVAGELDWIVMKSLEKDRRRRYETANDLAADFERHLAGEPVVAAPPSAGYRMTKLLQRHRGAFVTTALGTAMLVLGLAGTTWQWRKSRSYAIQADSNLAVVRRQVDIASDGLRQALNEAVCDCPDRACVHENLGYINLIEGRREKAARKWPTASNEELAMRMLSDEAVFRARDASLQRISLNKSLDAAQTEAYIANLALAQAAMQSDRWPEARQRLDACAESKRGWEWKLLRASADVVVAHLPIDAFSVSFNADGSHVLAETMDESICFDSHAQVVSRVPKFRQYSGAPFSPDGKSFIGSPDLNSIQIYGLDGKPQSARMPHSGAIYSVKFSADAKHVLTSDSDAITRVWNLDGTSAGNPMPGADSHFSPDGTLIVTSGGGMRAAGEFADRARVWTVAGKPMSSEFTSCGGIHTTRFSPDGLSVLSKVNYSDKTFQRFDLLGNEIGLSFSIGSTIEQRDMGSNGNVISMVSNDESDMKPFLQVLDRTGEAKGPPIPLQGREGSAWSFLDGGCAIAVGTGWHVDVVDLDVGYVMQHIDLPGAVTDVRSGPDGTIITTCGHDVTTLQIWSREGDLLGTHTSHQMNAGALEVHPTAGMVIARSQSWGSGSARPTILDVKMMGARSQFAKDAERSLVAALAIGEPKTQPAMVEVKNEADGKIRLNDAGMEVASFAMSREGSRVFKDGHEVARLPWRDDQSMLPTVNLQDHRAAFAGDDLSVRIYDTTTWRELVALPIGKPVKEMRFTPDGTRLILDLSDDTMELWDTREHADRQKERDIRFAEIPAAREAALKLIVDATPQDMTKKAVKLKNGVRNDHSLSLLRKLVVLGQLDLEIRRRNASTAPRAAATQPAASRPTDE